MWAIGPHSPYLFPGQSHTDLSIYSEQIKLVDNSSSASNTKLTVNNGKVGFWVYSGGSGLTAAIGVDDSGGNGSLSASQVSIDAIWFFRAQTSYNVYVYIDDVQYSGN